jgi:hypothetical protein
MTDDYIWMITDDRSPESVPAVAPTNSRDDALCRNPLLSTDPGIPAPPPGRVAVRVEQLEQSMTALFHRLGRVFRQATQAAKDLGEMELEEGIRVKRNRLGEIVGGKGAIALKFKRVDPVSK